MFEFSILMLLIFLISFFRGQVFFTKIIERLKIVYPKEYQKYLYLFGLKLNFWFFIKKVRVGEVIDDVLVSYYKKIITPLLIAFLSTILWFIGLIISVLKA